MIKEDKLRRELKELLILNMPDKLALNVQFINAKHETLFRAQDHFNKIIKIISDSTKIDSIEFLTYLLYTEQKDYDGFRYFKDFKHKLLKSLMLIEDNIKFENNTIKPLFVGSDLPRSFIEKYGVSVSLCLANKCFDLHEADWYGIPELSGRFGRKTLDFDLAATVEYYVQIESKGTTFTKNKKVNDSKIYQKKNSIIKKKDSYKGNDNNDQDTLTKDVLIGVIAILDKRDDSNALNYIVDPPAFRVSMPPLKYKLLSRLSYYYSLLYEISSRSRIISLLANRIKVLYELDNYQLLSGVSLLSSLEEGDIIKPGMFNNRAVIKNKRYQNNYDNYIDVIGNIYTDMNINGFVFSGVKLDIYEMVIKQDHERIVNFEKPRYQTSETVLLRIRKGDYIFSLYEGVIKESGRRRSDDYYEIELEGEFYYTKSGRVYGFIPIN